MLVGSKRAREEGDDALAGEVSAAIQSMAAETEEIVGSVGKLNGAVLESLLQRSRQVEDALSAAGGSVVGLWKLVVQSQRGRAASALSHIAVADDVRRKGHCIAALQRQLLTSASLAAEEVSSELRRAQAATVTLFASQLAGEQETNEKLVLRVREFLQDALESIQSHSRRATEAELALFKQGVSVARLQSLLSFYQRAALRHHEEVMALIKIVRILAAKSKDVDLAETKLRQSKTHVRLLEKRLELAGIVQAIVPPNFVPPRQATEPPNEALRRTAPEYFALRLLEHKDVTLSELVDSWQKQEARIVAAEERYRSLKLSVESLRREALTVHQGFLEEKRRRELVEQRLVDLVRERIRPSRNDALVQQLTLLRADHTKALDDLAQMATSLSVTREQLTLEQQRNMSLEAKVQQMQDDSANDEVAHTLASLRHYYEGELNSLRNGLVDADTQSAVAAACAEMQQKASETAQSALLVTEQTVMDMSATLQRVESQLCVEQPQGDSAVSGRVVQNAEKVLTQSEAQLNQAMSAFERVMKESEIRQAKDMSVFEQQVKRLLESMQSLVPAVSPGEPAADQDTATVVQRREAQSMMRGAVAHALQFVSDTLVTNEIGKRTLLDTSISDAHQISLLLEKVRQLTAERDAALERLARCERLIDQHSLTTVERVLMHEVSVEESIDAMEAAEQIATLRREVSSLEATRTAALAEVKELRNELKEDSHGTESAVARLTLLERHNNRLMKTVEECLAREVVLVEQVHQLQQNLQNWGTVEPPVVAETGESKTAAETERFVPLLQQLEQLSGGIGEMKEQLSEVQRAVISASREAEDGEEETQLLRRGVRQVADALREALQHAELFRHALPAEAAEAAPSDAEPNREEELAELERQLAEARSAHASELSACEEELSRLRAELETHKQIGETLRNHEKDLQEQKEDLQQKVGRLLQINKQLLEEVKSTRTASTTSAAEAPSA
ncbi:uncharacterized protein Tco025E_03595 [Trypanosoma conorhini]|uniref:Uncharacterized protein n=1 Tax=Trypanosoma conorhini TaxID=83891 RepID=A0A422PTV5_9TRYP|nr:uncharacterized protein Tco025E_03595 [Trypanosoma conorhini]RNF21152.1 hypothetical protein Tco025E_03595 [Trypanosoma conorhini]